MAPAMQPPNNPYAPPKALALEVPQDAPPEKSKHVDWACHLMWIGMGFSVLASLLFLFTMREVPAQAQEFLEELVGLAIGFAIVWWFTNKLRAGRNWMRMLVTILNVIGMVILAITLVVMFTMGIGSEFLGAMFQEGTFQAASMVLQMALVVCETVLINTPSARAWFEAKRHAD
jgi:hypothetical protein